MEAILKIVKENNIDCIVSCANDFGVITSCYVAEKMNYFRQHTQKVSAPANKIGLNIVQDHDIYTFISPKLALSSMDRRLICGYHMRAIMSPDLSEEGRLKAAAAWQQEKEFCRFSLFLYMLRQAWLKIQ